MLEVKAKVSPGTLDSSLYHKDHKMKITKRVKALDTNSPTWDSDYKELKAIEKEIDKLEDDEQAIIAEEQNQYKDNHGWAVFRLALGQECDLTDIDCKFHSGGEGDHSLFIKLKVVNNDKYVEKTKTGVYKPVASPPA